MFNQSINHSINQSINQSLSLSSPSSALSLSPLYVLTNTLFLPLSPHLSLPLSLSLSLTVCLSLSPSHLSPSLPFALMRAARFDWVLKTNHLLLLPASLLPCFASPCSLFYPPPPPSGNPQCPRLPLPPLSLFGPSLPGLSPSPPPPFLSGGQVQ